jgi:hypothetical protein
LNAAFSLNVAMQSEIEQFDIGSNNFVKGDFDFELQTLWMHMMGEVMAILAPFLAFATTYYYQGTQHANIDAKPTFSNL